MGGCVSKASEAERKEQNGASVGQPLSYREHEQQKVTPLPQQHRPAATADCAKAKPPQPETEAATVRCSSSEHVAAAPPASTVAANPVFKEGVFLSADVSSSPVFDAKVMQRVSATSGSGYSPASANIDLTWRLKQALL
jgi:hypothetical protein